MAIDALVQPLLRVALFHGLNSLQITEIARLADRIIYRPGDEIIREGQLADAAILVVSGEAIRVRGPELKMPAEPIPEGALLGEMAMFVEIEHTSTILARTAVRALRISSSSIRAQMTRDPTLAQHFVDRIRGRLRALAAELRKADRRIAGSRAFTPADRRGEKQNPTASRPAVH
jgi:cAMP-binding proteins - catabolite gene activator and regulatory subunit of cAMP-dependent protein kinases